MSLHRQIYFAVLVVLLLVCDSSAQSIGYWHLPSTQPQYCGLGYGPGHHVPMIRTHGCRPLRVSRCVHTRGCLSGGLPYCGTFRGACESPGCHAELDVLVNPENPSPESGEVAPEPGELPAEADHQVLPTPQVVPQSAPQY